MKRFWIVLLTLVTALFIFSGTKDVSAEGKETPEIKQSVGINQVNSFNNVVIFIKFADEVNYDAPHTYEYYENMFNGVDQISLRDYFLEVSYDQLTIDSVLVNDNSQILFYVDEHDRSYYQPYDSSTNPNGYIESENDDREHSLLKSAIDWVEANNLISDSINLDRNNDGDIDSITFMVSGEDNGWMSLLWPHKWSLNSYYNYTMGSYKSDAPMINGLYAWDYTFELLGNSQEYDYAVDVAVLAHETFHLISAPDLYHYYRYDWIDAIGYWGLMEAIDSVPSHMLGYMKMQYGDWIDNVEEINSMGSYTLYPLQDGPNNLYRIDLGYSNEYIYIEYRDDDGLYESTLPDTGLLVYRVDEDYYDWGNTEGYYDNSGNTAEEVWMFRPGMDDLIPPIEFNSTDPGYDVDGDIDNAALSQNNLYDEVGYDTAIPIFDSNGQLVELKIYNVVEHDGYITFDVAMGEPYLKLENELLYIDQDPIYVNLPGTYYSVSISNLDEVMDVYYTLDGTTPTLSSTPYNGSEIEFNAENNQLVVGIFVDGELVNTLEKDFTFVDSIETPHDGYGNFIDDYYYINFEKLTTFELEFTSQFDLSYPGDTLEIIGFDAVGNTYHSDLLKDTTLTYTDFGVILHFETNDYNDWSYGFSPNINIVKTFDGVGYYLNGDEEVELDITDSYYELGVTLVGEGSDDAYIVITSDLETGVVGDYTITYEIYDVNDNLVDTLFRYISVNDFEAPVVFLNGDEYIYLEVGEEYVELGATYTDNGTVSEDINIWGYINTDQVATYQVYYQITDDAGNVSIVQIRQVVVSDTTAPTGSLNPGIDTIYLGETWEDTGIIGEDNYSDVTITVKSNNINIDEPGTYKIVYELKDTSANKSTITRYVTVLEEVINDNLDLVCDVNRSTYGIGTTLYLPYCELDGVYITEMDSNNINTETPGTFTIYLSRTIDGVEYTFRTYIFVLNDYDKITDLTFINDDKRRLF